MIGEVDIDPFYNVSMETGDFNGDGNLDLAVACVSDATETAMLEVFPGNGDGTFGKPIITDLGDVAPTLLAAGDFYGQGRTDLVVETQAMDLLGLYSNGPIGIELFLAGAEGRFQAPIPIAVPAGSAPVRAAVVGDFLGNGRLGLAIATSSEYTLESGTSSVIVLPGRGDGTFAAPIVTVIGSGEVEAMTAADFGGGSHLDLAVSTVQQDAVTLDYTNTVEMLRGVGDGTFLAPIAVYKQTTPLLARNSFVNQLIVGDFNGDDVPDLLLGQSDLSNGQVQVLAGQADGSFVSSAPPIQVPQYDDLVVGDFNGDGRPDIAFDDGRSIIAVYLGLGDGRLVAPSQFEQDLGARPLLADVTGDGSDDLLVVDQSGVILWRHAESGDPGTFAPPVAINTQGPALVAIAVVQTTQGPIIAGTDRDDNRVTLFADRGGRFVVLDSLSAKLSIPSQILAADLTGNGIQDLVVRDAGDDSIEVLLGNGDGGFTGLPTKLPIGFGASSITLADLADDGRPDLVVTNSVTGLVTLWSNEGDGKFANPTIYAAGAGPYTMGLAPSGTASLDATVAVAAGIFTPQGPTGLVTLDPGSGSMAILEGLVAGALGNPIVTPTDGPDEAIQTGPFTDDGLTDVAVLGPAGLSVYLANGRGGFDAPMTYDVGNDPTGLTVADANHDGHLDLLVGDAQGDVLILLGDGRGDFAPPEEADQSITLALADLSGTNDVILADQGLDRIVVDYGSGRSAVLGDQASGVLAPGAVTLADLNGDGIPDLIVANSGGNDILVYPGLGDGQFGRALEGPDGIGFPVGTDPVSVTVADLNGRPDLIVADAGSNDVAILLNEPVVDLFDGPYLPGDTFTFATGPRLDAGLGPVSTAVQQIKGDPYPDLLVSDSGSNEVTVLQGRGGGYFSDQNPEVIPVGNDPGPLLLGDFGGRPGEVDLVIIDSGSDELSLIADINGGDVIAQSIPSGGLDPVAGLEGEFDGSLGLLVANNADGHLALFLGGPDGLDLSRTFDVNGLPHPTALVMDANGNIFGGSEGVEAAIPVILGYGASGSGTATPIAAQEPADQQVALLQPLGESAFAMVTTLLSMPGETTGVEGTATAAGLPNQPRSAGMSPDDFGDDGAIAETSEAVPSTPPTQAVPPALVRLVAGLDQELAAIGLNARRGGLFDGVATPRATMLHLDVIDQVITRWSGMFGLVGRPSWLAAGGVVRAATPGVLPVNGGSNEILGAPENPDNTVLPASNERAGATETAVPDRSDSSEDANPSETADVPIGASAVGLAVAMSSVAYLRVPSGARRRSPILDTPTRDFPGRGDREPRNRSGSR